MSPKVSVLGDLANYVRKIVSEDFEPVLLPAFGRTCGLLRCVTGGLAVGRPGNSPQRRL